MAKINSKILLLFLVFALITIISCTKSECSAGYDCLSRPCTISACEGGKCKFDMQTNCCGNKLKEAIENGRPGNECTCPDDYGKCEGKAKIIIGSVKQDSAYLRYFCSSEQCIMGVDKNDIVAQNFLDSINTGFFKASVVEKYNKPFDAKKDKFEFVVSLDDMSNDLILPVRLARVKILFSGEFTRTELLIADKELDAYVNGIGDQSSIIVPLNLNYKPQQPEESGSMRYMMDYSYTKRVLSSRTLNGTNIYTKELVRAAFSSPSKPVTFVRTG